MKAALSSAAIFVVVEAFDGGDVGVVASDRKGDAGAYRHAVDEQRAGAADAVLAAEMGAGQVVRLAQQIGEMGARLDVAPAPRAVDRQLILLMRRSLAARRERDDMHLAIERIVHAGLCQDRRRPAHRSCCL